MLNNRLFSVPGFYSLFATFIAELYKHADAADAVEGEEGMYLPSENNQHDHGMLCFSVGLFIYFTCIISRKTERKV